MTSILLDTHTFVWAVNAPQRLGERARDLIEDPRSDVLISAATAWELGTKTRLGRFPEAEPLVAQYPSIVSRLGGSSLAISAEHALRASSLRWDHRDPFDRMLAAQAMIEHAVLLTRDHAFARLAGLDIAW